MQGMARKVGGLVAAALLRIRRRNRARPHRRLLGRRVPGRATRGVFQAVHGHGHQDGRGKLGRRRGDAPREDPGRQQQLGRRAGRVGGTAARLRGRALRKARLGQARRQGQVPARCRQRLRRGRHRLQLRPGLRRRQDQGRHAEELGRFLEHPEVAGQARAAQGPEDHARDRADGRRRGAAGRVQDARHRRPASSARSRSSTRSRATWSGGKRARSRRSSSRPARW